jgi:hypothetical protein
MYALALLNVYSLYGISVISGILISLRLRNVLFK